MFYEKPFVAAKLRKWERIFKDYRLPEWDELPSIELYMDQVIDLLSGYLEYLMYDEESDTVITPSIINNYVRLRIMPPPVKKRYSKVHLAYLIMICTLKQSLNIAYVKRMIPIGLPVDAVKSMYSEFVEKHKQVSTDFINHIRKNARPVLDSDNNTKDTPVSDLVMETAISANLYKLLTEKVVNLQNSSLEDIEV